MGKGGRALEGHSPETPETIPTVEIVGGIDYEENSFQGWSGVEADIKLTRRVDFQLLLWYLGMDSVSEPRTPQM